MDPYVLFIFGSVDNESEPSHISVFSKLRSLLNEQMDCIRGFDRSLLSHSENHLQMNNIKSICGIEMQSICCLVSLEKIQTIWSVFYNEAKSR